MAKKRAKAGATSEPELAVRREPRNGMVGVKVTADELDTLRAAAKERGFRSVADLFRAAVTEFCRAK